MRSSSQTTLTATGAPHARAGTKRTPDASRDSARRSSASGAAAAPPAIPAPAGRRAASPPRGFRPDPAAGGPSTSTEASSPSRVTTADSARFSSTSGGSGRISMAAAWVSADTWGRLTPVSNPSNGLAFEPRLFAPCRNPASECGWTGGEKLRAMATSRPAASIEAAAPPTTQSR